MSTRRERLERKAQKRREWAEKAAARMRARLDAADQAVAGIPPGQPILVGHHSERRHRRALEKCHNNTRRAFEEADKAKNHRAKAAGLDAQLDRNIYSDDPDAIEALRDKIATLEQQRDNAKATNAAWRKAGKPTKPDDPGWAKLADAIGPAAMACKHGVTTDPMHRAPFPSYWLQNIGANIKRCRDRIAQIERRQKRQEEAEQAGGLAIIIEDRYARVQFAEKPERTIRDALKAAGFYWSSGAWCGLAEDVPACVKELMP